jgi:hypothetical protein
MPIATLHQSASRNATLAFHLYEAVTRELAAARDLMLITGQRNATERVAGFLVAFSRRNVRNGLDPTAIELPMTRRSTWPSGCCHRSGGSAVARSIRCMPRSRMELCGKVGDGARKGRRRISGGGSQPHIQMRIDTPWKRIKSSPCARRARLPIR